MINRRAKVDLGNAISMEDALSIMVVTFVLFFLFLIPLVNIDRMKLEEAQKDTYWEKVAEWITEHESSGTFAAPYLLAFGLKGHKVCVTEVSGKKYIEAISPGGELVIVKHFGDRYISLSVKENSSVVTYRFGEIRWSGAEQEWFTINSSLDYGELEFTNAMQKEYRQWTKETRGF